MNKLFFVLTLGCCIIVFVFYYSKDWMTCMLCLLLYTFLAAAIAYMKTQLFRGLGMMLIVMATGLFLIFAYLVSVNSQVPFSSSNMSFNLFFLMFISGLSVVFFFPSLSSSTEFFTYNNLCHSHPFFSATFLIFLLLTLVVTFLHLTQGKGGSLREKF